MSQELIDAIANMDEERATALTKDLLAGGTPPTEILDSCRSAMEVVGSRFEHGEYFIPELILAGEMLKNVSAEVKPYMTGAQAASNKLGKVVVGTVKGDIHDIGKDIVVFMLDVNGFEVYDLGIDVPVETFVNKVAEVKPQVIALSGFLTLSYDAMKETVAALKAAGLRDDVKIMVGGGTVDEQVCRYAGADAYGLDAMSAVTLAKGWVSATQTAA